MIRKAKLSEVLAIKTLIEIGSVSGQVLPRSLEDLNQSIATFFVFEEKAVIVGCVSLDIYNKKLAEIRSLAVLPQYQNCGIGSKLIQRCLEEAKQQGIYEVLAVTSHQRLFETVGFKTKLANNKQPLLIKLG